MPYLRPARLKRTWLVEVSPRKEYGSCYKRLKAPVINVEGSPSIVWLGLFSICPESLTKQNLKLVMDLTTLKMEFVSSNWAIAEPALDSLVSIGGDEVLDFFISFLDEKDVLLRNRACIGLHDLADSRAVEPLMKAILKKENENSRGTMVYALDDLDCTHLLPQLFDLLFYGNAEVKMGVTSVLDRQIFEFDSEDLYTISAKWKDLKLHPEKCPDYDESKQEIEHFVDGFLAYLKE